MGMLKRMGAVSSGCPRQAIASSPFWEKPEQMPCLDEFQRLDGLIGIALVQLPWVQSLLRAQPILRSVISDSPLG